MDSKIKVAEFISRLEFGGAEAMLLNYTTHFQHPEQFDLHIITQDINDDDCIRQFEDAGYTVHIVTHKRKSIAKNVGEVYQELLNIMIWSYKLSPHKIKAPYKLRVICKKSDGFSLNEIDA